jgi:hypothetical protein
MEIVLKNKNVRVEKLEFVKTENDTERIEICYRGHYRLSVPYTFGLFKKWKECKRLDSSIERAILTASQYLFNHRYPRSYTRSVCGIELSKNSIQFQ